VGALTTRAEPAPESATDGSFRITGQKIYITWADHDMAANISHLVLARLPGAPAGTRGISLFHVPKLIDGQPNALRVVSLEHKMGLHASPTAVMAYDGATGWIVGAPGGGMAAMFTMMNNARLGVAMQGIGVAETALRMATAHAADRRQGGRAIIDWPDVRRMLATARAQVFAARAIAIDCAIATDMATRTGDPAWAARAGVLTPIAKAFGTDTGVEVTTAAIQVFGGMGVIEDTGLAQLARDVRVTTIYEGTNGIQALDLAGRKLADGGTALRAALDDAQADAAIAFMAKAGADDRQAGAVPFLRAMALILGAQAHARAAAADPARAPLAAVFRQRLLPQAAPLLHEATGGAAVIMASDLAP
jgi:alkylation response protein AidB-like acyl-CoA dehydrogenase